MWRTEATSRAINSSDGINEWMAQRWVDLGRLGSEAEAAGREAWGRLTRSGQAREGGETA
jgi:hypothetical protein